MASRWRDGPRGRPARLFGGTRGERTRRRDAASGEGDGASESLRDLPRWMRLYFYGMHGVALDVVLSSLRGLLNHRDPKLVGFSSPYLCIMHALSHLALEKIYSQKRCFRARPVVFHLVFYPSVYIGLQILIGTVRTWTQLAVHYVLALYYAQVFHRGLSRLQYHPLCAPDPLREEPRTKAGGRSGGSARRLPGLVRFLFFGMHGFLDEVLFTSVFNLVEKSDRGLSGHTSLWSFLMYGSCGFVVDRLYLHLHFSRGWGTWRRLPIYVCFIYTWELSWGLVLRQFDACSWDYSHYPHNFLGLITPLYLPGWVCLSLYQDVLSNVLLRIKCTKDAGEVKEKNGEADKEHEMTLSALDALRS
ncbi:transmembrane protein 229A [Betta splendens]|uniref:Transmembrane protein 229A n=1 Tax=Betta splendens TaxID=158456 RepID=A0A6P7NPT4_BETSP|nr:transmembrane protein 229A [Betta splendens]